MLDGLRVGVTGATGFLGSHLARVLADQGATVVGIVRSPEKGAWLLRDNLTLRHGDLTDGGSLQAAFAELDAVVSNATLTMADAGADLDAFVQAEADGTTNVVDAALAAGVTRFVHISSVSVYRLLRPCRYVPEDHPRRQQRPRFDLGNLVTRRGYADSKARAEEIVWGATERGLRPTVLRPGPVYGSRDGKLTQRYLDAMASRIRIVPTVGLPHVHAGDVAQAAVGALENDASIGEAYNITGEPTSLFQVARTVRRVRGGGPLLLPLPVPLWLGWDNSAAERDLGVSYRSLADGMREAVVDAS